MPLRLFSKVYAERPHVKGPDSISSHSRASDCCDI